MSFADLVDGRDRGNAIMTGFVDDASRAWGHLVATVAGALQTDRIVLAGEDVASLARGAAVVTVQDVLGAVNRKRPS